MSQLSVRIATPEDRARWNAYVDETPTASVYHRFEWGEIFEAVYGQRFQPLIAEADGVVRGILPMTALSRGPLGTQLVSMPYFAHAGALATDAQAWRALVMRAEELRADLGAAFAELRHAHPVPDAPRLEARDDKVLMVMPLEKTVAALEKRVGSKTRSDVRRPQREGMTAQVGGRELVGHFHEAYASVMRDLGSPCHAASVFDEAMARFRDRAFIVRVIYQGRTVGAAFLVGQHDTLEVPCAGTLHALNKLRPNMLLYWSIFCAAIERGYAKFSFGRSTVDAGTYHFKKNWGAEPIPLPYHYLLPAGSRLPLAHVENPWLKRASQWWSHLPVSVTTALGPQIVRHLA